MSKWIEVSGDLVNLCYLECVTKDIFPYDSYAIKFMLSDGKYYSEEFDTREERDARFEEIKKMLVDGI